MAPPPFPAADVRWHWRGVGHIGARRAGGAPRPRCVARSCMLRKQPVFAAEPCDALSRVARLCCVRTNAVASVPRMRRRRRGRRGRRARSRRRIGARLRASGEQSEAKRRDRK